MVIFAAMRLQVRVVLPIGEKHVKGIWRLAFWLEKIRQMIDMSSMEIWVLHQDIAWILYLCVSPSFGNILYLFPLFVNSSFCRFNLMPIQFECLDTSICELHCSLDHLRVVYRELQSSADLCASSFMCRYCCNFLLMLYSKFLFMLILAAQS